MTKYIKIMAPHKKVKAETLSKGWAKFTPGGTGKWGQTQLTTDSAKADFFVMVERGSDPLAHRGNTIYLQREPHGKVKAALRKASRGILYSTDYHASTWWVSQSYDELVALKLPAKPKNLSSVMTGKTAGEGRSNRLKFLVALSKKTDIDVYGKFNPKPDPNGFLTSKGWVEKKETGLLDYRFTVAMEHMSRPGYFSEKLVDCFLCWCKPIYFGAPNIASFFPPESYIWIDPTDPQAVPKALHAMKEPIDYDAIATAREAVLNRYNVIATIDRKLHGVP